MRGPERGCGTSRRSPARPLARPRLVDEAPHPAAPGRWSRHRRARKARAAIRRSDARPLKVGGRHPRQRPTEWFLRNGAAGLPGRARASGRRAYVLAGALCSTPRPTSRSRRRRAGRGRLCRRVAGRRGRARRAGRRGRRADDGGGGPHRPGRRAARPGRRAGRARRRAGARRRPHAADHGHAVRLAPLDRGRLRLRGADDRSGGRGALGAAGAARHDPHADTDRPARAAGAAGHLVRAGGVGDARGLGADARRRGAARATPAGRARPTPRATPPRQRTPAPPAGPASPAGGGVERCPRVTP